MSIALLAVRLADKMGEQDKTLEILPFAKTEVLNLEASDELSKTKGTGTTIKFFFFNFYFYFVLLYNIVLVLPYIDMNQPRVYMSSQS